jgi:hypothetical protein
VGAGAVLRAVSEGDLEPWVAVAWRPSNKSAGAILRPWLPGTRMLSFQVVAQSLCSSMVPLQSVETDWNGMTVEENTRVAD